MLNVRYTMCHSNKIKKMPMIFSDVFEIITNMDIFQHDELSKNTNLKSSQCRKIQERKKRVK